MIEEQERVGKGRRLCRQIKHLYKMMKKEYWLHWVLEDPNIIFREWWNKLFSLSWQNLKDTNPANSFDLEMILKINFVFLILISILITSFPKDLFHLFCVSAL